LSPTALRSEFLAECAPAVAAQFTATPGIALTATYDTARFATEIMIAPMRSLLDTGDEAQFMPAPDVERFLDEIAPGWTRTGKLEGGSMQSGCNESRIEECSTNCPSSARFTIAACPPTTW
jgi:hypothetical protein